MQQLKAARYSISLYTSSTLLTARPSIHHRPWAWLWLGRRGWGVVWWICCAIGRISRRLPALLNLETSSSGATGGSQYGTTAPVLLCLVGSGTQCALLVPSGDHECRPCQILNAGLCCVRLRSARRLDAWLSPEDPRPLSLLLSVSLSVCLSVCVSVCLSVSLSHYGLY